MAARGLAGQGDPVAPRIGLGLGRALQFEEEVALPISGPVGGCVSWHHLATMKIYTRKGDDGTTGLFGGVQVSKADARVGAYGLVDEANAVLGWARAAMPPPRVDEVLDRVQQTCFAVGARLAAAPGVDPGIQEVTVGDVEALELAIDRLEETLPPLKHFVLPGGGEAGARLHVARTVFRRAERAVAALAAEEDVPAPLLAWLNRLSDYLFVAARAANADAGVDETIWAPRS